LSIVYYFNPQKELVKHKNRQTKDIARLQDSEGYYHQGQRSAKWSDCIDIFGRRRKILLLCRSILPEQEGLKHLWEDF